MKILSIESSCDETAAAVVENGTTILGSVVASSTLMHAKYGGIVPEVAAREQLVCIIPTIEEALKQSKETLASIDQIAITVGPGLIGSLLVGVETAKTIAFTTGKPLIPVNHVLAHMYANFVLSNDEGQNSSRAQSRDNPTSLKLRGASIEFPAISLVVSGGHTELYLMKSIKDLTWLGGTLDDAAGEAFDKTARLLGFENRGGPAIQEAASQCHPGLDPGSTPKKIDSGSEAGMTTGRIKLPRPLMHDKSLNFSFSGLKTAVLREWNKCHPGPASPRQRGELDPGSTPKKIDSSSEAGMTSALAYEVQESITDVLVKKTLHAASIHQAKSILLSGGVAANLRLREKMNSAIKQYNNITMFVPPVALCTDNAVYIASYAYFRGSPTNWHDITAVPDLSVEKI